jgi:hypothetical protein
MSQYDDFAEAISERMKKTRTDSMLRDEQFLWQDFDGDFVEFFAVRDAYYSEYVDSWLTVYYGRMDQQIIGAKISHVSDLLDKAPGIRLEVRDGEVELKVLFMASRWTTNSDIEDATPLIYEKVRDIAERIHKPVRLAVAH